MRNKALMLILCLGGSLVGCSSKPDVGDISAELNRLWEPCPLVKVSNLKKTNGVENGNAYRMAYSYTLEFFYDSGDATQHCSMGGLVTLGQIVSPFKFSKGDVITLTNEIDMIKSEKGWIAQ